MPKPNAIQEYCQLWCFAMKKLNIVTMSQSKGSLVPLDMTPSMISGHHVPIKYHPKSFQRKAKKRWGTLICQTLRDAYRQKINCPINIDECNCQRMPHNK